MADREALAAALDAFDVTGFVSAANGSLSLIAAARERLAQMPERCGDCVAGYVDIVANEERCPTCYGYARVYPAELVERIARIIAGGPPGLDRRTHEDAVAVLDALNETP